jgi:hypothetical protein
MAIPNATTFLANPALRQAMLDAINELPVGLTLHELLPKPPKFRKAREVHAQRARKLRRRGEYVHFVRWEHGRCIYSWGGPVPEIFTFRFGPSQNTSKGVDHG